jgi:hypothetical protein
MLAFLKRLFSDPTKNWEQSLDDSVLGNLRLNEDATWWESSVTTSRGAVSICIPGETVPNPQCRAAATDFVRNFETIAGEIAVFLQDEAAKKRWGFYRSIIPNLGVAGILYHVHHDRIGAMIDLGEDDAGRAWRCSFESGRVSNLAFDS